MKKKGKKLIQELKKMDTSYNPTYINYMNDKLKDITLEETSQEEEFIHQKHAYFSVISSAYGKTHTFQLACNHKDPE